MVIEVTCWDYMTDSEINVNTFVSKANQLGDEGWELVDVSVLHGFHIGIFKRPMNRIKEVS